MKKNVLVFCFGLVVGVFLMLIVSTNSGIFYKDIIKSNYEAYELNNANATWESNDYLEAYRHYKNIQELYKKDTFLNDDFWTYDYPVRYILLRAMGGDKTDKTNEKMSHHYEIKAGESLERYLKKK